MPALQHAIQKLFSRGSLSSDEAEAALNVIMDGTATQAQIGAYLGALRVKGESLEEIVGSARAMRAHALRVPTRRENLVDVVGTGGDRSNTFNISTTSMFVVAGAGAPVAKHGNRAASSQAGSADVLGALGVNVALTPAQAGQCIDEIGIGFMFAQTHHPAMKHAAGPRRELAARTIFNILGPLTNPAGARRQLLGVFDPSLISTMASVLRDLGSEHVLVVNSAGVDELTTIAPCNIGELRNGTVTERTINAVDFGFQPSTLADLAGSTPEENAIITRSILAGTATVAQSEVVLLNSGAALYVAGLADDINDGIALARKSVDSGAARAKLDAFAAFTHLFA